MLSITDTNWCCHRRAEQSFSQYWGIRSLQRSNFSKVFSWLWSLHSGGTQRTGSTACESKLYTLQAGRTAISKGAILFSQIRTLIPKRERIWVQKPGSYKEKSGRLKLRGIIKSSTGHEHWPLRAWWVDAAVAPRSAQGTFPQLLRILLTNGSGGGVPSLEMALMGESCLAQGHVPLLAPACWVTDWPMWVLKTWLAPFPQFETMLKAIPASELPVRCAKPSLQPHHSSASPSAQPCCLHTPMGVEPKNVPQWTFCMQIPASEFPCREHCPMSQGNNTWVV